MSPAPRLLLFAVLISILTMPQALSQHSIEGTADPLAVNVVYLSEGFNQLVLPPGWNVSQIAGPTATWTMIGNGSNPPAPPYSGAGQARFNSFDAGIGQQARLTTRAINFSSAADPFVQFFMYHDGEFTSSRDSLYIEVSTSDSITGPWISVSGLGRLSGSTGWRGETIALTAFVGAPRVFVSFRGVSKFGNNIFVDEVTVLDSVVVHDVGAVGIFVAGTALNDQTNAQDADLNLSRQSNTTNDLSGQTEILDKVDTVRFGVVVQNFGTAREIAYQVKWMVDGVTQVPANNINDLLRNGRDTLYVSWLNPTPGTHLVTAWASLLSDTNHLNDTVRLTVQLPDSSVVFYETFNGSTFPPAGWTVINRDGGTLLPWFQGTTASPLVPFEGTGYAADNFQRSNGNYLDDYLVSPAVPGVGLPNQTDSLIFWCRSTNYPPPNPNYPDSLMILLSTSGPDTSSFNIVVDYFPVPKASWTRKAYRLNSLVPSNSTVRVAFRYLHYNAANADYVGVDAVQFSRRLPTSRPEEEALPARFALSQNYPNPFNPSTTISYGLAHNSFVTLTVFNTLGQQVAQLVNEQQQPGYHQVVFRGDGLASGVYFYHLQAGDFVATKKLLLAK